MQYLPRSLSVSCQDSDRGYRSHTESCSVHGTLKRHISSGIDTTIEDDCFDDFSFGADKQNGGHAFPFITGNDFLPQRICLILCNLNEEMLLYKTLISADKMLKGGKVRSRAGSLSSPTQIPAPRLGVSGLYTDYMERRRLCSGAGSSSPPDIPSPPPPVTTATLGRKHQLPPPPPPNLLHCNGHINMANIKDKKTAFDISNELTQRINELGTEQAMDPLDSLGHLKIKDLPELSAFSHQANDKYYNPRLNNVSPFM